MNNTTIRETLVRQADQQMAAYPQYVGHFDTYGIGVALRDVKTRLGLAVAKGETVLVSPEVRTYTDVRGKQRQSRLIYSARNRVDTSVPFDAIRVVASQAPDFYSHD